MNQIQEVMDLVYEEEGKLYWVKSGKRVGYVTEHGYRAFVCKGLRLYEHRVIFSIHHDYIPTEVDHINRDKLDNRISNLREVTRSENSANRTGSKLYYKHGERFRSVVKYKGKNIHIGMFNCPTAAMVASILKKEELYNMKAVV